jgi:hypothetical protein
MRPSRSPISDRAFDRTRGEQSEPFFNVTVPATMMRSDCLGLGRKIPAPKRSISKRDAPVAIISMAQQARTECHRARAQTFAPS